MTLFRRFALISGSSLVAALLLAQQAASQVSRNENRIRARAGQNVAQNRFTQQQQFAAQQTGFGQRDQVTLTGQIVDLPTFFMGGSSTGQPRIFGTPVSPQTTFGSPPTAFQGANANPAALQLTNPPANVPGAVNPNTAGVANLGSNPNAASVNPNVQPGTQTQRPAAQNTGQPFTGTGLNQNMAGQAPVFVLLTGGNAVLVTAQSSAGNVPLLQPTASEVQLQGQLWERGGMRLMIVTASSLGTSQGVGTGGFGGGPIAGQSGTTAIGQPQGTNAGQSGTSAVGQPNTPNIGQSGTTATGQNQRTNNQSGTNGGQGGGASGSGR